MTLTRRALVASALGAGISYSNLAVALPLLVLALRRGEEGVVAGLAAITAGDLLFLTTHARGALVAGALVHGAGMGLFWVGVQASLGRRSGQSGSQRAFVLQYVVYIAGSASGAALTGASIAGLRALRV